MNLKPIKAGELAAMLALASKVATTVRGHAEMLDRNQAIALGVGAHMKEIGDLIDRVRGKPSKWAEMSLAEVLEFCASFVNDIVEANVEQLRALQPATKSALEKLEDLGTKLAA